MSPKIVSETFGSGARHKDTAMGMYYERSFDFPFLSGCKRQSVVTGLMHGMVVL